MSSTSRLLFSAQDQSHLTRALSLARQAAAFASPNPAVGCVLTRDDVVLGEGAHYYDERDHAEIVALKQASASGRSVHGATAYVTLEPCSHQGRTGPCANALIAAGIRRCVVATVDPNPLVRGRGLALLRSANMAVVLVDPAHPLAQQARSLNDAFAHFIQHRRPFVTLKAALSADGKLAPPPSTQTPASPYWITGTPARADVQLLRHASDAILTGIGTVLADDPSLTDRTGLPRRRPLLRIVLDSNLRIPSDSRLVTSAANDLLLVCSQSLVPVGDLRAAQLSSSNLEILRIPSLHHSLDISLDIHSVLRELAQRQILSVLIEAGARINAAFLSSDLVDRVVLYYSQTELGHDAISFAANSISPFALQQHLLRTTRSTFPSDLVPNGEDVRIAGYLHDPWVGVA
ncbi:MAG: bifunctional diaminohydroxyphosphoribosylaminopyrimidine deaminase/5-amino-6-(5-phosphoribosylamino)uracil reductase RibD [Acidobacteriaceae bacterium]